MFDKIKKAVLGNKKEPEKKTKAKHITAQISPSGSRKP